MMPEVISPKADLPKLSSIDACDISNRKLDRSLLPRVACGLTTCGQTIYVERYSHGIGLTAAVPDSGKLSRATVHAKLF
jgi:hypothetical protein